MDEIIFALTVIALTTTFVGGALAAIQSAIGSDDEAENMLLALAALAALVFVLWVEVLG